MERLNSSLDDLLRQEMADVERLAEAKGSRLDSLFQIMETHQHEIYSNEEETLTKDDFNSFNEDAEEILIDAVMPKDVIEQSYAKGEITMEQCNRLLNVYNKQMNEQRRKLFGVIGHYITKNPSYRNKDALVLLAHGYNHTKFKVPLTDSDIEKVVAQALDKKMLPSFVDDKGEIIPYELANLMLQCHHITSDGNVVYRYKDNHYEIVEDEFYFEIDKYVDNKKFFTKNLRLAVLDHIQNKARNKVSKDSNYINFKNGLLNMKTRKLEPHTHEAFTLGTYNAEYHPEKADITGTAWERFLLTTVDADVIPLIQEMIGLCLFPLTRKIQRCFILYGGGANGKSILLNTINEIVPSHLRSSISMGGYDERFTNSMIKDKQVNICTDDPTTHLDRIGNFKCVMSGEPINVERKNQDLEQIEVNLTHISSFNRLPTASEKTEALLRRLIIIEFNKSFGTIEQVQAGERDNVADLYLEEKIKQELDIIVAWAIEGVYRVLDNFYKLSETESTKMALKSYEQELDTVAKWISECVVKHAEMKNKECLKAKILFTAYKEWCDSEGYISLQRRSFDGSIKRLLGKYSKPYNNTDVYRVSFKGFNRNN